MSSCTRHICYSIRCLWVRGLQIGRYICMYGVECSQKKHWCKIWTSDKVLCHISSWIPVHFDCRQWLRNALSMSIDNDYVIYLWWRLLRKSKIHVWWEPWATQLGFQQWVRISCIRGLTFGRLHNFSSAIDLKKIIVILDEVSNKGKW